MKNISKIHYLEWPDVVRVIAITLVVAVHCFYVGQAKTFDTRLSLTFFILAKNCVPLFVMLSGALLLPKQESLGEFFSKRLKRVLLPWLFWTGVFVLVSSLSSNGLWVSPLHLVQIFRYIFVNSFSFLPVIFCLYLLVPPLRIISKFSSNQLQWYLVVIWFLGISLLPYLRNSLAFPLSVDNGLVRQTVNLSGFLLLGYLLATFKVTKKSAAYLSLGFLVSGAIIFGLVYRYSPLDLIWVAYTSPLIIISSAALFLVIKYVASINHQKIKSRILRSLSQASFGIFLIHPTVITLVDNYANLTNSTQFTHNMLRFSLTLTISLGIILGLSLVKRLKPFIT